VPFVFYRNRGGSLRNKIQKRFVAGFLFCAFLMLTGCSTTWVAAAEQMVAVLIPATANLMALVATFRGNATAADLQTIQNAGAQTEAGLQLIQSLIAEYDTADVAAQPGLLSQIQAGLSDVQSNLNGLLPALHIKDASTQAKITAVVELLISEMQAMAAIVPLANPGASAAMVRLALKQIDKRPMPSSEEFVTSFNAIMTGRTGNASLDRATSGLRIHAHGKFERLATAGLLK
jgi:hypothetical protein